LDVNSKFEIAPAVKDIEKLRQLIDIVRPAEEEVEV
jgi:phosphoribosylanthranilate isomerase